MEGMESVVGFLVEEHSGQRESEMQRLGGRALLANSSNTQGGIAWGQSEEGVDGGSERPRKANAMGEMGSDCSVWAGNNKV